MAERIEITGNIVVHHPVKERHLHAQCCYWATGNQADCCCGAKG